MAERRKSKALSAHARRHVCPAPPQAPLPELPERDVERRVKAAVRAIDVEFSAIEKRNDELGNALVELLFRDNPAYALDPTKHPTVEYKAVYELAGAGLRVDSGTLSRLVRVGALNKLFGMDSAWGRLAWSFKVELLTTLQLDGTGGYLSLGIDEASKPDATVLGLRAWKKSLEEETERGKLPPPGLTFDNLERLISHGEKLRSGRARSEFIKKLMRLSDAERAAVVARIYGSTRHVVETLNRYASETGSAPFFTFGESEEETTP